MAYSPSGEKRKQEADAVCQIKDQEGELMESIVKKIDHTLLRQDITSGDIERLCREAREYGFYSVMIHALHIPEAVRALAGSGVKIGTVVGFPFGETPSAVKAFEAKQAVLLGADEVDMVAAVSRIKEGLFDEVEEDIRQVVRAVPVPVKVIVEASLLTKEELVRACECCIAAGAAFVKTSTGYFGVGATVENIRLMKSVCGEKILIKAAGGIRDYASACALAEAGADRLGTSAGVAIVQAEQAESKG